MIDVKLIAKPKNSGSTSAINTSAAAYSSMAVTEAAHAAKADIAELANEATHAAETDHAAKADEATHAAEADLAAEADNADKWDGQHFADYLDQPVRKTDKVEFDSVAANDLTTTTATIANAEVTEKITAAMGEIAQLAVTRHTSATTYDEIQTMLKGVIAELVKSADFDEPTQQGFSIDKMDNGKYKMFVTALEVWGKATFNELEVRKLSYAGGNIVLSAAGSTIKHVENVYAADGTTLTGWKCYLLSDDGTTATQNTWVVDDQAKCQTFNIENGTTQAAENRYYWRLVTDVSTQSEQITNADGTPLYDGLKFQWIVLSATDYDTTSTDTPQPGDTIAQMGNRNTDGTNAARTNLIQIVTSGDTLAPFIAAYKGVTGYYLTDNEQVLLLSPTKVRISSNIFEWVSAGGKTIGVKNYRGDWTADETPYMYYDEVTYQGTLWLCVTGNEQGTYTEPSPTAPDWKAETHTQQLRLELDTDTTTLDEDQQATITAKLFYGEDRVDTTEGWTWRVTRDSGNAEADTAWNEAQALKTFTGTLTVSHTPDAETDDLAQADGGVKFRIVATKDDPTQPIRTVAAADPSTGTRYAATALNTITTTQIEQLFQ